MIEVVIKDKASIANMIRFIADGIESAHLEITKADFSMPVSTGDGWQHRHMSVDVRSFVGWVEVDPLLDELKQAVKDAPIFP